MLNMKDMFRFLRRVETRFYTALKSIHQVIEQILKAELLNVTDDMKIR
jgi:hypothetical protein